MTIPNHIFSLRVTQDAGDFTDFAHAFVGALGTAEVSVYNHEFDGGELGRLELDLEGIEVDFSDAICEYTIRNAIQDLERSGGLESSSDEQRFTLTQVREAYCEEHDCSPYDFLARVGEEITEAAMNARDRSVRHELRQAVERAEASVEADKLVVEQALEDRNKAQKLYGKQAAQMREAVKLLSEVVRMQPGAELWDDTQREFAATIQSFLQGIDSPVTVTETETIHIPADAEA